VACLYSVPLHAQPNNLGQVIHGGFVFESTHSIGDWRWLDS